MPHAGHLEGPDGLRVEAVRLGDADVAFARAHHPDARAGQTWFLLTRHGRLVAYCRDVEEVAEHVDLSDLHGPGEAAEDAC
ncbi:hypothetical protein F8568_021265 [Actinomadura sp. LD22]|uniref:Uncharacterized protein n=1 Tax=Actinomadura physcomitrii TaxID=2650748 RepID=A0A6I4MFU3_9ACTN|nr:hypothetical protein [Actinomadura physcomitrii]MWA02857.1 hypothetical protein [Actinomadura physcomitrii]